MNEKLSEELIQAIKDLDESLALITEELTEISENIDKIKEVVCEERIADVLEDRLE